VPTVEVVVDWRENMATTMTSASRPFGDVERGILSGSGSHHLSRVTHIIRYCNNPVVYDVSWAEGKYNMKVGQLHLHK
jgi:hypothetical protein